jgi:hypothetical protein
MRRARQPCFVMTTSNAQQLRHALDAEARSIQRQGDVPKGLAQRVVRLVVDCPHRYFKRSGGAFMRATLV